MDSGELVDEAEDQGAGTRLRAAASRVSGAGHRAAEFGTEKLDLARERSGLLDHAIRAHRRFRERDGVKESAALSFYGFLCTFPFLVVIATLLAFTGDNAAEVRTQLLRVVHRIAPGMVPVLSRSVRVISEKSVTVGIISLAFFLWTAVTVVQKLQQSLADMFGIESRGWRDNGRVFAFLVATATIVAISFFATGLLDSHTGLGPPVRAGGAPAFDGLVSLAADMASTFLTYIVVGVVMLTILPGHKLGWKVVRTGALIGAVGWTVLYTVGVRLVASYLSTDDAAYYGIALSTLILLVTTNVGARITLMAAAWAAENMPSEAPAIKTAWVDSKAAESTEPS